MQNLPTEVYNNSNCISQQFILMSLGHGCITYQHELHMLREIRFYFIIYSNLYFSKTCKIRFHYNPL